MTEHTEGKRKRTEGKRKGPQTPEARAKVALAARARWQDPEFRERMKAKQRAAWTPELKAQASERAKLTAKTWTPEQKAQARERTRAYWADPANVEKARQRALATMTPEILAKRAEGIHKRALNSARPSKVDAVTPGAKLKGVTVLALVPGSEQEAPYRQQWICECNSCGQGLLVRRAEKLVYRPEKKTSCGCRQLSSFERENKRREALLAKLRRDVAARREAAEVAWQEAQKENRV